MNPSDESLVDLARSAARSLVASIDGPCGAVVASADGFELAHAGDRAFEPARVAAMASSLAALGDAASRETSIGETRSLVVESSAGRLVVRCIRMAGGDVVIALLTDASVLLGSALARMAEAERLLSA